MNLSDLVLKGKYIFRIFCIFFLKNKFDVDVNKFRRSINDGSHDRIRPYFLLAFLAENSKELNFFNNYYLKILNFLGFTTSL
jgi:hypothetical protein